MDDHDTNIFGASLASIICNKTSTSSWFCHAYEPEPPDLFKHQEPRSHAEYIQQPPRNDSCPLAHAGLLEILWNPGLHDLSAAFQRDCGGDYIKVRTVPKLAAFQSYSTPAFVPVSRTPRLKERLQPRHPINSHKTALKLL